MYNWKCDKLILIINCIAMTSLIKIPINKHSNVFTQKMKRNVFSSSSSPDEQSTKMDMCVCV